MKLKKKYASALQKGENNNKTSFDTDVKYVDEIWPKRLSHK